MRPEGNLPRLLQTSGWTLQQASLDDGFVASGLCSLAESFLCIALHPDDWGRAGGGPTGFLGSVGSHQDPGSNHHHHPTPAPPPPRSLAMHRTGIGGVKTSVAPPPQPGWYTEGRPGSREPVPVLCLHLSPLLTVRYILWGAWGAGGAIINLSRLNPQTLRCGWCAGFSWGCGAAGLRRREGAEEMEERGRAGECSEHTG